MDATGIAYNHKGNLLIHKEPKSAYSISFKHPDDVTAIMGHTRHTIQGNEKKNYNIQCQNQNFRENSNPCGSHKGYGYGMLCEIFT